MFKVIFNWARRIFRAVGSFVVGIFRRKETEQYMSKKSKQKHVEPLAQGETEEDRKYEDELLARMKQLHNLAQEDASRGDPRRLRIMLSGEATAVHDRYQEATQEYLKVSDTAGPDAAYPIWKKAMTSLVEYITHLTLNDPTKEREVYASIATSVTAAAG